MLNKKTVRDIDVAGKRVLCRVDFNVPIQDGKVGDDTRIRAALPTIEYLIEHGAAVILCSHLGRPKGGPDPAFSLAPVAEHLRSLTKTPVKFVPEFVGEQAREVFGTAAQQDDAIAAEHHRPRGQRPSKAPYCPRRGRAHRASRSAISGMWSERCDHSIPLGTRTSCTAKPRT